MSKSVSARIAANYPDGRCPDCNWKIRKDVEDGTACRNCSHVFYLATPVTLTLTLKVKYRPDGTNSEELRSQLNQLVTEAVGNGRLTGDTPATVEKYSYTIVQTV